MRLWENAREIMTDWDKENERLRKWGRERDLGRQRMRDWENERLRYGEREWKRNETLRDSVRENERDSVNIFNFEIMIFNIIK